MQAELLYSQAIGRAEAEDVDCIICGLPPCRCRCGLSSLAPWLRAVESLYADGDEVRRLAAKREVFMDGRRRGGITRMARNLGSLE